MGTMICIKIPSSLVSKAILLLSKKTWNNTSKKGIARQRMNQQSTIFMSEVLGNASHTLTNLKRFTLDHLMTAVNTYIVIRIKSAERFTATAVPKLSVLI